MMACRKQKRVSGGNEGLALDIAHYNYELRFRSCGLSRGAYGFALRTHQGLLALWNLARG